MANATEIHVHNLVVDQATPAPTPDILDTGTSAVVLPIRYSEVDRLLLEVTNNAGAALNVKFLDGEGYPSSRTNDFSASISAGATVLLAPRDASCYVRSGGKLELEFRPASGTLNARIRCIRMPK